MERGLLRHAMPSIHEAWYSASLAREPFTVQAGAEDEVVKASGLQKISSCWTCWAGITRVEVARGTLKVPQYLLARASSVFINRSS